MSTYHVTIEGTKHEIEENQGSVALPDGRVAKIMWLESYPPQPRFVGWRASDESKMSTHDGAQAVINMLRAKHTADNPATIEQVAEAYGIDVTAPCSYRDVLDMSDTLAACAEIVRFWVGGERRYFAARA